MFYLKIRSRHPSHSILRRLEELKSKYRIVYRLGSTTQVNNVDFEINTIESIKNSSNKLKMKELFNKHEINNSEYYTFDELDKIREGNPFPILAKKIFGSKGAGMKKLNNLEDFENFINSNPRNYYFEKYFNGSREYRLHVTKDGCFYSCRKMRLNDAEDRWYFNSNNCVWITEKLKNLDDNNQFISFSEEDNPNFNKPITWDTIVEHSIKAINAIGLTIGAVDVRVKKDGSFIILETNSAPSFGDLTKLMYIDKLKTLIKF